jgi:uroporphyrin-III C-methyltransferase
VSQLPGASLVSLVGAGPGDPGLLTLKAYARIQAADVVVYDRLVSAAILELVPPGTSRIFAGKAPNRHRMPQDEINDLLVRLAGGARRVVRLKGGDPFIFGRGSEEARHLARNGIPFEIVPGITAASGCAAYAGIPLTHRGVSESILFVTGRLRDGSLAHVDWESVRLGATTLVIYMGLANIEQICRELIDSGLPPETPAAVIENGTTPDQRTVHATIASLADRVRAASLRAPALFVIGRVVELAPALQWFAPAACDPSDTHDQEPGSK